MKKITLRSITAVIFLLVLCSCTKTPEAVQNEEKPAELGGWQIIEHEAEELPAEVMDAFNKAIEKTSDFEYVPVSLMASQQVSGMNYCILCQLRPLDNKTETKWALVYIYVDTQGNSEIRNVYELYIAQHSTPK